MNFLLDDDHKMVRETARAFAEEVLAPGAAERDEKEIYPAEAVKQMAELGFLGVTVPEKYGGAGMDYLAYALIMEEIARVDASAAVVIDVNNSLVCDTFQMFGNEEQKQKYLVPLAKGEKLSAFALTEPGAGSDPASLITGYRQEGDLYILNGTKRFITNAAHADVLIVFATKDRSMGYKGISAFIVEKDFPGFSVTKKEKKLGIRASDTCELAFEDCRVPVENLIGPEGKGLRTALSALDNGRIGIAGQALGIAQGAFDAALAYSKERKQFGKTISEFQGIQFKLAEMVTELEAARLLTYQAAWRKDRGLDYVLEAAMAKLKTSAVAVKLTNEAVQIHGGYGYITDFPVERFFRDAKITEIYEGTSEIQKIVIARKLLK
ncbi:acyl-CoA dehydrogenase [bacterium BMS3Abin05]|nr:acyl-CoA dehydrogenase [bacterium BMS3Abin05]GBE26965.1 acyl-CoA dehydrogenase [bacterium BMS3Bbin03]HDZ12795.1 acyl-CoA dehydrogenase [Bacteroidota bacterium]